MINQTDDATNKNIAIICEKMSDNKKINDDKESEMKSISKSKETNEIAMENKRDNAFPVISANNETYNNNQIDDLITSDKINTSDNTYEIDENSVYDEDERRSPNVQSNTVKESDDQLCQEDIVHLNSPIDPKQDHYFQNEPSQETPTIGKGKKKLNVVVIFL
jgi:hypothetical protein